MCIYTRTCICTYPISAPRVTLACITATLCITKRILVKSASLMRHVVAFSPFFQKKEKNIYNLDPQDKYELSENSIKRTFGPTYFELSAIHGENIVAKVTAKFSRSFRPYRENYDRDCYISVKKYDFSTFFYILLQIIWLVECYLYRIFDKSSNLSFCDLHYN